MKEGWEYRKIGELFSTIKNGANIKQRKGANGIPITRIETLANGVFNVDRLGYADIEEENKYVTYYLNDGDILMSHINSMEHVGRSVVYHNEYNGHIIHGMNLLRLVPININSDYCVFYFKTKRFKEDILSITHKSVNQASFNTANLKNLQIPIPPLSEQQEIVDYLDSAFAKIDAMKANAEKALEEGKALFQSALKQMLEPKEGWEEKNLVNELKLKSGDYLSARMMQKGGIPVYGGNGIAGYHNNANLTGEQVLIGRVGALCGNVHYTNSDIWVTDNAFVVNGADSTWHKKFLAYELVFLDLNQYASQTAQPVISNKSMKDVIISKPPKSEQQHIVETLDSIKSKVDQLQENYDNIAKECDILKQAILRQVFE